MKRILVTGGDGVLGRSIVDVLAQEDVIVRVMSRKPMPEGLAPHIEWAQADVMTGEGVDDAVKDVHTIVNCLSSPVANTYETDIVGTRDLLGRAKEAGAQFLLHISIVGIDRTILPYFQYKLAAEIVIMEAGIPYLISRIGQFHGFVDYMISALKNVESAEVAIPENVQFQSISPAEVAEHLKPFILDGTRTGRLDDFSGPEVLPLKTMVEMWLAAQGMEKVMIPATDTRNDLPIPHINDYNLSPDNPVGVVRWQDYLRATYEVVRER